MGVYTKYLRVLGWPPKYSYNQPSHQAAQTQSSLKRVAIYGGAFDPPTNSHMTCASEIVTWWKLPEMFRNTLRDGKICMLEGKGFNWGTWCVLWGLLGNFGDFLENYTHSFHGIVFFYWNLPYKSTFHVYTIHGWYGYAWLEIYVQFAELVPWILHGKCCLWRWDTGHFGGIFFFSFMTCHLKWIIYLHLP